MAGRARAAVEASPDDQGVVPVAASSRLSVFVVAPNGADDLAAFIRETLPKEAVLACGGATEAIARADAADRQGQAA